jgi:predicted O-methyltransferase YrrM
MKAATFVAVIASILLSLLVSASAMSSNDAPQPPSFSSVQEHHDWVMNTFLPWMEKFMRAYHNVPRADGEFLKQLVEKTKRRHGLEMGSANGYSAIWIGLGMEKTKGDLKTIEIEPDIAAGCRENIKKAGLEKTVTCITGDALIVTPKLQGPFDLLFIDIGPIDMTPFVKAAESKLTRDAMIVMHNLAFISSYKKVLEYAASKGWHVQKVKPEKGMGLVLISPNAVTIDLN